ncbi:MAG TPA: PA2779 family protein [Thermoanaerobaculia bacterium]|nr:PA2779 family protein [Thermoanaerobaculia bacterium]
MANHGLIFRNSVLIALVAAVALVGAVPVQALPTPSKTAADQSVVELEADLTTVRTALDRPEVAEALAAQGFSTEEVNLRLAQLSPQEISSLAGQVEQVQAAGVYVPTWAWIVIVVALVVLIVAIA